MTTNSEVGKLILANRKLSELNKPFNIYYPYFLLAEKLHYKINEFFKEENIEFLKEISCSTSDASSFSCHKGGPVKSEFTLDLKSIILGFLGLKIKKSEIKEVKRPIFKGLNWEILDGYKENLNEAWAKNVGIERDGRIRDFWLRARNCNSHLDKSPRNGHSSFETLDLIAACSGYTSFADFLQKEFGEGYEKEKDELLQALVKSSNKTNIVHSQRKNKVKAFKIILFKRLKGWSQTAVKPIKSNKRTFAYLLVSLGMAISFFIMSISANDTQIKVVVSTRYLNFETAHASLIRSNESLLLACDDHFSIKNGVYSLDYPYPTDSPGSARFKPIQQNHIGIEYLKIPALSQITIEAPTQTDLYLNFSASPGLNGFIPLNKTMLFSPDDQDSVIYENSPSGIGVNFESYIDQNVDITMVNSFDFEWPPIYINSVNFGQHMQDQVEYGIESAQLTFLNDNKIKNLDPGDLLTTTFKTPIKLLLSYSDGMLHTEFTGSVNTLYAGPEILGKSSKNNLMPKIGEKYWAYFLSIFSAILVIIHLGFRSGNKVNNP